jgi:hypothetical protein
LGGGGGEYCGDSNAQLDRINEFYHEASGCNYVFRAVAPNMMTTSGFQLLFVHSYSLDANIFSDGCSGLGSAVPEGRTAQGD